MSLVTKELLAKMLPRTLESAATDELVQKLNGLTVDPDYADQIKENFITYARVLQEGNFKVEDYIRAVLYVSFKHMGHSNHQAWCLAFPERHQRLVEKGTQPKDIASHVSAYHRGKLVNMIMERSLVPIWVLNQEYYQRAINTQVRIMEDATLPAVARTAAANSLMTHLAKPKEAAQSLNIHMPETSGLTELKSMLAELARNQREAIEQGTPTKQIASQRLVPQRIIDVEPSDEGEAHKEPSLVSLISEDADE